MRRGENSAKYEVGERPMLGWSKRKTVGPEPPRLQPSGKEFGQVHHHMAVDSEHLQKFRALISTHQAPRARHIVGPPLSSPAQRPHGCCPEVGQAWWCAEFGPAVQLSFVRSGRAAPSKLQHAVPTGGVSPAGNIYPIGLSGWGGWGGTRE